MYDRQTMTLWGNLTGEPVVGKLATSGLHLKVLPMTLTTWKEWKKLHPETKVLHLSDDYGKQWNYRYIPGLADRTRSGVSFPVWQKSKILKDKEEVYALRVDGRPKAYVIQKLLTDRILNDQIGETPLVLIMDAESESVRAYERGTHTFSFESGKIKDESGRTWQALEEFLVSAEIKLERIPGHTSWWFAWFGFFPQTDVYR